VLAFKCADGQANSKLVPRLKPRSADFTSFDGSQDVASSDEDASLLGVASGTGILEFSPIKAGLDVTPANLEFSDINGHTFDGGHKLSPPPVLTALESKPILLLIAEKLPFDLQGTKFCFMFDFF
jgi:hypothetical protein